MMKSLVSRNFFKVLALSPILASINLLAQQGPTSPTDSCQVSRTDSGIPATYEFEYAAICTAIYECSPSDPWPLKTGELTYVASIDSDDHCYDYGYTTPTTNSVDLELVHGAMNGTETGNAVSLFYGRVLSYRSEGNGCDGPYVPFYSGVNQNACTPPPPCVPNYDDQPPPLGENGLWEWDPTHCRWVWHIFSTSTPIIIDTDGSGFHLTSAAAGIKWDFFGNGNPIQIAWTAAGSTNGWLAIDLNGNGSIDSAKELFSNVSPQPANPADTNAPDGFNALGAYDTNHDNVIDSRDPVWPRLLVWIDSNHDGISQPGELHHLGDLGINSISVNYSVSPLTDAYGNEFHLKGHLNPDKGDSVNRVVYDVYLTTAN